MWYYQQSTGRLWREDFESVGYSGKGVDKNNPASQSLHNRGPIPRGKYYIHAPYNSTSHGPYCLPLSPFPENVMYGRSAFLIHGDSTAHPGEASEGCIIQPRAVREKVWTSPDHELEVVE